MKNTTKENNKNIENNEKGIVNLGELEKVKKSTKGITLIALVITIIVLLILAGVTIATLTGDNGVLKKTQKAKNDTIIATEKEEIKTALSTTKLGEVTYEKEDEDDYYNNVEIFTTELDKIVGEGKTIVQWEYQFEGDVYGVEFVDTGNKYYVIFDWNEEDRFNGEIKTEEEMFKDLDKNYEDVSDTTEEEKENLSKGLEIEINSGSSGSISIEVGSRGIIDWGDGTYSKINMEETKTRESARVTDGVSKMRAGGGGFTTELVSHSYAEKNKIYKIKIYSDTVYMNSSRLQKILKWGETNLIDVYFADCKNLESIASPEQHSFENIESFSSVFRGCTKLKSIPQDFFNNCPKLESVRSCFAGCTNLTGSAPELWKTGTNSEENEYMGDPDGESCFYNCTKLDNYNEIPEYWKKDNDRPV